MSGDRMGARRSLSAGIVALIATTTLPTSGWPQVAEDAVPTIERKERIEPGWQIVAMPELEDVKRKRFEKTSRSIEAGNELRRREVHYTQERMGRVNFGIWDDGV